MTGTHPRWNIEHVNGDRGDYRWSNLRAGARGQKALYRASWREPTKVQSVWQVGDVYEAMVKIPGHVVDFSTFKSREVDVAPIGVLERADARRLANRCRTD